MRIDLIESLPQTLQRRETFTIARGSSAISEVVFVAVHSGRLVGHGCAAPTDVTMENVHSVLSALKTFTRTLAGFEFDNARQAADRMDKVVTGNPSAKAAMDMALHDLAAKEARMPLYAYLGGRRDRMPTDVTIGLMGTEAAVDRARRWVGFGFQSLKVKVGSRDWREDYKRLKAIRDAVGKGVELRVDANQGYRWQDALAFARKAEHLRIAFFEQPVSVDEWEGMRVLTESSPIPIMADEMAITPDDVKKLRWAQAARAVNLKLMKHGGIVRAEDVNAICESAGYPVMVGCMGEPQLSIAAGLHFALATKNVRWIDLDSYINISRDPTSGLRLERGQLVAPAGPGLGIHVDFSAMT